MDMDSIDRRSEVRCYANPSKRGVLSGKYIVAVVGDKPWVNESGQLVTNLQTRSFDHDAVPIDRLAPIRSTDSISWFYLRPARAVKGEG